MDNTSATNAIVQFNEQKIQSEPLIISKWDIPFSFKTLSDEMFLQYLHDSPPIDGLFVFYSIFWIILLILCRNLRFKELTGVIPDVFLNSISLSNLQRL